MSDQRRISRSSDDFFRFTRAAFCGLFQKSGCAVWRSNSWRSDVRRAKSKMPPEFADLFPDHLDARAQFIEHGISSRVRQ
jgi:hypothetical protein